MEKTIAVHDGIFHPDEVFGVAIIMAAEPETSWSVIRTRDVDLLKLAHIRVDVGGKYDPKSGDFDHHQDASLPAACSLVWAHYGPVLTSEFEAVEADLFRTISGLDCNFAEFSAKHPKGPYMTAGDVISGFNRPDATTAEQHSQFMAAVAVAKQILANAIFRAEGKAAVADIIRRGESVAEFATLYEKGFSFNEWRFDPQDRERPFVANLLVMPQPDGKWAVVSMDTAEFNLAAAEGEGLVFAHKNGFFAKWETKEQAMAYAREHSELRSQEIDRWAVEHNDGNGARVTA